MFSGSRSGGVQEANDLPFDAGLLVGAALTAGVSSAAIATAVVQRIRRPVVDTTKVPDAAFAPSRETSAEGPAHGSPVREVRGPDEARPSSAAKVRRVATVVVGFVVLVVGALVFGVDSGVLALTVSVLLTLVDPRTLRAAFGEITLGVVLLLTGIVTFLGVLDRNGTIVWAGEAVASIQPAVLAALLICVIGAVSSAFASTLGMMVALVPMTVPLVLTGDVSAAGIVVALGISASLVDVSPFSTCGALAMANAPRTERERIYRGLLGFAATVAVLGPLVSCAILVASGWF